MRDSFECENCKKEVLRYPSEIGKHIFCSQSCCVEYKNKNAIWEKAANPLWGGGQVEKVCQECGNDFSVRYSYSQSGYGQYCSRECQHKSKSVLKICEVCGAEFRLKISHSEKEGHGRYCSIACRSIGYVKREVFKGKNNPRYIDGKSTTKEYVCRHSHMRRTRIAKNGGHYTLVQWEGLCKQYDYRCLACGNKKKLTVDHVVPVSLGGSNDISNIQPLCMPCNAAKSTRIIDYRDFVISDLCY